MAYIDGVVTMVDEGAIAFVFGSPSLKLSIRSKFPVEFIDGDTRNRKMVASVEGGRMWWISGVMNCCLRGR